MSDKWDDNEGDAEHDTTEPSARVTGGRRHTAPIDASERRWRPQSDLPTLQDTIITRRKEVYRNP